MIPVCWHSTSWSFQPSMLAFHYPTLHISEILTTYSAHTQRQLAALTYYCHKCKCMYLCVCVCLASQIWKWCCQQVCYPDCCHAVCCAHCYCCICTYFYLCWAIPDVRLYIIYVCVANCFSTHLSVVACRCCSCSSYYFLFFHTRSVP